MKRPAGPATSPSRFQAAQQRFFQHADVNRFRWQTENPYLAETERVLLEGFPVTAGAVLEIGCGEGGNLRNLWWTARPSPRIVVGLDLFEEKLAFARRENLGARFVCGDALALPFRDGAFDVILSRDLLHHVGEREAALRELRRVATRGAVAWIIEPNGRNPLIFLLALLRPHERGQLGNSVASLRALVARHFQRVDVEARQPFPLYRVILHYRFGIPALGRSPTLARVMNAWDRALGRVWPRLWWAYIVVKAAGPRPSEAP